MQKGNVIDLALEFLDAYVRQRMACEVANEFLEKAGSEMRVAAMDENLLDMQVAMLDEILGDEIASYFVFECHDARHRPRGGWIQEGDVRYQIKTIGDVRRYVMRKQPLPMVDDE